MSSLDLPTINPDPALRRHAAERAKRQRLGLWAGTFELPWEWRAAH